MEENNEWSLIKKIKGLNLEEKIFEVDKLPYNKKAEAQISKFKKKLEDEGHEIFKIEGHQFITSDGVYFIAHKSEISFS